MQKAALQEVLPGYEEYLVLLQERNRLLKKMRKKSSRQIENERKEQGFSLYVSGANADKEKAGKPSKPSSHKCMSPEPEERLSKPTRLKTAGDVTKKRMIGLHDLEMLAADEKRKAEEKRRLKTAPARERRRNWMAGSVDIKTERGERCKLRPPETVTDDYDDDFEDDESDEEKVKMEMSNALEDSDSDIEIDASKHTKNHPSKVKPKAPPPRSSQETFSDSDPESEGENEKLLLSLADIKRLRASLAMNKSIRESLAKEVSSDFSSSDEEILEHIQSESSFEDEESREPPSPIAEDVEEDLVPAMDSVCLNDNKNTPKKKSPFLKPTDTVVLELAAPPTKNKVERNLSAARKKDVDLDEDTSLNRVRKSYNSESKPRAQSATVLQSNTPRKSSNRPLSANRVSQKEKLDSDAEANAVMRALREENEKASRLKQEASSHKLPHTSQQVLSGGKPMASPRKSIDPPKKSSDPSRSSLASPRYSSEQRPSSASSSRNVSKHPSSSVEKRPPSSSSSLSKNKSAEPSSTANVNQSFLSDERLTDVMKKVMLMQPKQQKRLFKMLGNLEESTESGDKSETVSRTPPSKPVKATVPVKDMVSPVTENKPLSLEDTVEVNIELLSTWGHKELIGLTELQFFDERWQLIKLTSSNISLHGCRAPSSNLDVLFNGKAKSNKDRNMWCCKYRPRVPVEICVSVPTTHAGMEVSKIKIWNYNKSLTELDIGVKHARIFVGGELIFDGNIEKGCGNQVFDYGFNVYVKDNDKVSPRDEDKSSPKSLSPVIHVRSPRTEKVVTQKQNVRSPSPSTRPSNGSSHTASESTRATATLSTKVDRAPIRSETRTMNHSERNLPKPVMLSDRSGSETEEGQSKADDTMTVRADGSPRVYLPYLTNRGGQRAPPRRYGKDLFKPSVDNHMVQAYYEDQKSTRPEPRFPYTGTENTRVGGHASDHRRDSNNLPSIHKPQPTLESPRRRKTWKTRQGRGGHNNVVPSVEETPRKRGSWVVPDSEDAGPRLYNPQRSKLRNVALPNLSNPRENAIGYDDNVYSSTESLIK
ncbi:hypothetical protein FSP39_007664 [Pinctada imbricata]|uniref:KATNIP domain-containing protein n=1 Tax=Pinctada imbricata TaxID=66713 RepID=A0AA89BWE0_PINIB|nr:hypothetical protein FSP39_007664 [Pinctada imbricata]